jgi:hypothetical protein
MSSLPASRGHLEELLSARLGERELLRRLIERSAESCWPAQLATCESAIAELERVLDRAAQAAP